MSGFNPGAIITRSNPLWDGDPPSWLRGGTQITWYNSRSACRWRAGALSWPGVWANVEGFSVEASDIVYRCIAWNEAHPDEAPMWPWYGGDEAPADYSGRVLFGTGWASTMMSATYATLWSRRPPYGPEGSYCIMGYQRRTATVASGYAEAIMSKCDRCGKSWPSAPAGVVHKCECGDGVCNPPEAIKYTSDVVDAVQTLLEQGRVYVDAQGFLRADVEPIHTSGYAETIEESPEDFARAACERAGGVFVPFMTEGEADAWAAVNASAGYHEHAIGALFALGIIRLDPNPIDRACEAYGRAHEQIEGIAAILNGEVK